MFRSFLDVITCNNILYSKYLPLTLSMLGNFACFFLVCGFFFFFKSTFSKKSFRNTIRVSNSLDPDQARRYVELDLGPNCLQRSSADNKQNCSRLKSFFFFYFNFCYFSKKIRLGLNCLLKADDSHEMSSIIFSVK